MNALTAIVLGVIEGITEFLPLSSTAHLLLASRFLDVPATDATKSFVIAIQLGAILSVVVLFAHKLFINRDIAVRVFLSFLPTMVLGFLLHDLVKNVFFESFALILGSLFIGGAILIVFEMFHGEKRHALHDLKKMSYKQALMIGVFQSFAMVPGVSRSAATVIGGLILGLGRKSTVEFSFLLAIPTMLAATSLDLYKTAAVFTTSDVQILVLGFVFSFIVALISVRWLLRFVEHHSFVVFGVYRMIIAGVLWFLFF